MRRAEHGVERVRSGAELRRVRLAERDRAGRADARDDERVLRRDVVSIERRTERRANAGRGDEILVRDRQSVQRTERPAARLLLVGLRRVGHRAVGDERDDRVDLRIDALDAREVRGHDVARRDLLLANAPRELDRRERAELVARSARRDGRRIGRVLVSRHWNPMRKIGQDAAHRRRAEELIERATCDGIAHLGCEKEGIHVESPVRSSPRATEREERTASVRAAPIRARLTALPGPHSVRGTTHTSIDCAQGPFGACAAM